jgi:hypothetical protein
MARAKKALENRKATGLGFVAGETHHGFVISVPKGTSNEEFIRISELRDINPEALDSATELAKSLSDPSLRVVIDRRRWLDLAPGFWDEANRRLRANGLAAHKFQKYPAKPIPIHPSLGKELCILCWAVETAPAEEIPNALKNWEALAPEERWWLYTMTVASTGQAMRKDMGWRKALRFALADNPFVKGEGLSPKERREMLGHTQLTLNF